MSGAAHRRGLSRREAGFTLLELALALAIMAVLAGAVLVPFVAQVNQRNVTSTEQILADAKESLIGFAAATGRLPCPATATSNGQEAFQVTPPGDANNGACAVDVGFLPAVTLGLTPVDSQGFAVDAWGTAQNRLRYAVWSGSIPLPNPSTAPPPNLWPFTRRDGMRTATPGLIATTDMYFVCASGTGVAVGANCGSAVTLTRNAPVVIWSSGPNAASGGSTVDEAQNPNTNGGSVDRIFVSHTRTDTPEFDDVVTWIAGGLLISRMVLAGTLP